MAAATQTIFETLTIEHYLSTSYHPDCDFVDGQLEERNMGDSEHSDAQSEIIFRLRLRKDEWGIRVNGELRTRTSERHFRVPDVCVRLLSAPRERVVTTPPLIAIEILSPDDRMNRVIVRLNDYATMGVPNIWLLDPIERVAYSYTKGGLRLIDEPRLTVPDSPVFLDLFEIFSALD